MWVAGVAPERCGRVALSQAAVDLVEGWGSPVAGSAPNRELAPRAADAWVLPVAESATVLVEPAALAVVLAVANPSA